MCLSRQKVAIAIKQEQVRAQFTSVRMLKRKAAGVRQTTWGASCGDFQSFDESWQIRNEYRAGRTGDRGKFTGVGAGRRAPSRRNRHGHRQRYPRIDARLAL